MHRFVKGSPTGKGCRYLLAAAVTHAEAEERYVYSKLRRSSTIDAERGASGHAEGREPSRRVLDSVAGEPGDRGLD